MTDDKLDRGNMTKQEKRNLLLKFIEYLNPAYQIDTGSLYDEFEVDDFLNELESEREKQQLNFTI